MDPKEYKTVKTRRGYTYSYFVANEQSKTTILFLHGFPSTSRDWLRQVEYFSNKGYKVIAPDLLGYGETSHPTDYREYTVVEIANDVADILAMEHVDKTVAIAHDWGSTVLSRLVNLYPDLLQAVAFLVAGYRPPTTFNFDYDVLIQTMRQQFGYDVFGYWEYFSSNDAPKQIEENIDSFYSLIFPHDPKIWRTDLAPLGKIRQWVEGNKQGALPSYIDEQGRRDHQTALLKGGLLGPLNYYTCLVKGGNNESESKIPDSRSKFSIPCFFGAALQDCICLAHAEKLSMPQYASNLTIGEFDTSHWIMAEAPDALNAALDGFIKNSNIGN